ncbi:MAG: hypothetical protein ACK5R5_05970 [Alphaproteobacteria bacterium]|jgi:hypothetical protein
MDPVVLSLIVKNAVESAIDAKIGEIRAAILEGESYITLAEAARMIRGTIGAIQRAKNDGLLETRNTGRMVVTTREWVRDFVDRRSARLREIKRGFRRKVKDEEALKKKDHGNPLVYVSRTKRARSQDEQRAAPSPQAERQPGDL